MRDASIFFDLIIFLGLYLLPLLLLWGWFAWFVKPKERTLASNLSLTGFVLANASALLAGFWMAYTQTILCPHTSNPLAAMISRVGYLFCIAGFALAIGGIWRPNSLRWHAPASAAGILVFWFAKLLLDC